MLNTWCKVFLFKLSVNVFTYDIREYLHGLHSLNQLYVKIPPRAVHGLNELFIKVRPCVVHDLNELSVNIHYHDVKYLGT